MWKAANGTPIFIKKVSSSGYTALAWSANGKYIAGANSTGVSVWNASNGSLIATYTGQQKSVLSLAFSPDSTRIATGAMDKTVHIWHPTTGASILTYNGHNTANGLPVASLSWSPDGKQIVSGTSLRGGSGLISSSVKVWNTSTGADILTYSKAASNAVAWAPSGSVIASEAYVNRTETVQLWAPATGHGKALTIAQDTVKKISWSPASKYIALVLSSYQAIIPTSRIEVHSVNGSAYTLTYKGHTPNVNDVTWSPDGSRIASCADDKTVQIWQAPK